MSRVGTCSARRRTAPGAGTAIRFPGRGSPRRPRTLSLLPAGSTERPSPRRFGRVGAGSSADDAFGEPDRLALDFGDSYPTRTRERPPIFVRPGVGSILVGGRNLTAGLTAEGDPVSQCRVPAPAGRRVAHRPLDPLLHEERLPTSHRATSSAAWYTGILREPGIHDEELDKILELRRLWWMDHGLGAALPSYRIPDVHFRRWGELVEISWDDSEWRTVPSGVVLTEIPGAAPLPVNEVVGVLERWCRSLLEALAISPEAVAQAGDLLTRLDALCSPSRTLDRLRYAAGQKIERIAMHLRKVAGVTEGTLQDTMRALLGSSDGAPGYYAVLTAPVLLFRSAAPNLSDIDIHALLDLCHKAPERGASADFQRSRRAIACPLRARKRRSKATTWRSTSARPRDPG